MKGFNFLPPFVEKVIGGLLISVIYEKPGD